MIKDNISMEKTRELQSQVLQLLGWTEEDYSLFIFETGLEYLGAYFPDDEKAVNVVKVRREFWTWFKNQWHYRDQTFVESFGCSDSPLSLVHDMYISLHDAEMLASDIYPTRQVLGDNFQTIKNEYYSC